MIKKKIFFMEKMRRRPDLFMKQIAAHARLISGLNLGA